MSHYQLSCHHDSERIVPLACQWCVMERPLASSLTSVSSTWSKGFVAGQGFTFKEASDPTCRIHGRHTAHHMTGWNAVHRRLSIDYLTTVIQLCE